MGDYVAHQVKSKVEKFVRSAVKIVFIAVLIIVFILLFGYAFMWLWNWLMPDIFGLTTLTYWQAIGLLVMAKLVFGGFEGGGRSKRRRKSKNGRRSINRWTCKSDVSQWKHYDSFWEEEGETAYQAYRDRMDTNEQ